MQEKNTQYPGMNGSRSGSSKLNFGGFQILGWKSTD
jgi:hypothetical protein